MKKCKKYSNIDEAFEEMTKKAEKGISLAEQIVDLKSDHEHNLKLMKGLNDKIGVLERENADQKDQLEKAKDLIQDMYDRIPASHSDYYKDVMERARQFIKEIEK